MSDDKKESTGKRGIFGVLLRLGLVKEENTIGNTIEDLNSAEQKDLAENVKGKRSGLRGLFRRLSRSTLSETDKENQPAQVNRQSLSVEDTPPAEQVDAKDKKNRPAMPTRKPLSVVLPLSDQPASTSSSSKPDNLRAEPTQESEDQSLNSDTDTLDEDEVLNQTLQRISEEGGLSNEVNSEESKSSRANINTRSRKNDSAAEERKWVRANINRSEKELSPQNQAPEASIQNNVPASSVEESPLPINRPQKPLPDLPQNTNENLATPVEQKSTKNEQKSSTKSRLEAARERIRENPKDFPKPKPLSPQLKASREELAKKLEAQRAQIDASKAQRDSDRKAKLEVAQAAKLEKTQEVLEQQPKSLLEAARERIKKEGKERPPSLAEKLQSSREQLEVSKAQREVARGRIDEGNTVLHSAVLKNDLQGVKKLLQGIIIPRATELVKLDPNIQNTSGKTALHLAVEKNDLACVKALLEGGAKVDIKDKNNENPIDMLLRLESEKPGFDGDIQSEILDELLKDRKVAEEQKSPPKRADVKEVPEPFRKKTAAKIEAEVKPADSNPSKGRHFRS